MPGIEALRTHTDAFLSLHWHEAACGPRPCWVEPFVAARPGPYPNHQDQGCYALFEGPELRYIGVAASRGTGGKKGRGIGARIQHVIEIDRAVEAAGGGTMYRVRDRWRQLDVSHLSTIGFEPCGYLAGALESYLLTRPDMTGLVNKHRPGV